jgi:hypothetical protein
VKWWASMLLQPALMLLRQRRCPEQLPLQSCARHSCLERVQQELVPRACGSLFVCARLRLPLACLLLQVLWDMKPRPNSPDWLVAETAQIRKGLLTLRQNLVLIRDPENPDALYPRWVGSRSNRTEPFHQKTPLHCNMRQACLPAAVAAARTSAVGVCASASAFCLLLCVPSRLRQ